MDDEGRAPWAFLLPALDDFHLSSGGALNTIRLAELMGEHTSTELVTYGAPAEGYRFLDEVEPELRERNAVFCYTWGPDVEALTERLSGARRVYRSGSADWAVSVPPEVPIFCNSRFLMLFWMHHAPHNLQFLVPPVVDRMFVTHGGERDIDVLVVWRKSTRYLKEELIPRLERECRVHVQREFVDREELADLYRRSKVYLYAMEPRRVKAAKAGYPSRPRPAAYIGSWAEGFGTQPLEALACGCTVFSNLRGGMVDFLDVGVDSHKLEVYSPAYDVERIIEAVASFEPGAPVPRVVARLYSEEAFHRRMEPILETLEDFFEHRERGGESDIAPMFTGFDFVDTGERVRAAIYRTFKKAKGLLGGR